MNSSSSPCCCRKATSPTAPEAVPSPPSPLWRRGRALTGWALPSLALALMPKCPACVAAYVAVATGIGISMPTATVLRTSLIALCVGSLLFLALRKLRRVIAARAAYTGSR